MLEAFFNRIPRDILKHVENLELKVSSERCRHDIDDLLARTVLIGGKRLRPLLTFLFGRTFLLSTEQTHLYATSIEMVHAASLAHDDVIDQATTRRGKPSINAESSNKRAVLAGDYLLADVIMGLTKAGNLELVSEMANVIYQLSLGEWLQLDASEDREYSREIIEKIALAKTSSVMSWCSLAPATLANLPTQSREQAKLFGHHLGLAFQMIDDALDFSQTGESFKDQYLDLENGIVNSVVFRWLEKDHELFSSFKSGENLQAIVTSRLERGLPSELELSISEVRSEAREHLESARSLLDQICREFHSSYEKQTGRNLSEEKADLKMHQSGREAVEFILDYLAKRTY